MPQRSDFKPAPPESQAARPASRSRFHAGTKACRPPTREEIERARAMYTQGFTVSRILAATDMSLGTLYYWLDGGPGAVATPDFSGSEQGKEGVDGRNKSGHDGEESGSLAGAPLLPPIPRRKQILKKRRRALKADRVSLTARLWRTAERQVRDVEERLAQASRPGPERERDVRMLGTLVRTLRDLSAFDVFDLTADAAQGAGTAAAEEKPDVEALRASVMRKLEAMVASRQAAEAATGRGDGDLPR